MTLTKAAQSRVDRLKGQLQDGSLRRNGGTGEHSGAFIPSVGRSSGSASTGTVLSTSARKRIDTLKQRLSDGGLRSSAWDTRGTPEEQTWKRGNDAMMGLDLQSYERELAMLLQEQQENRKVTPGSANYLTGTGTVSSTPYGAAGSKVSADVEKDIALRREISAKQQYLNQARYLQDKAKLATVTENADFDAYSADSRGTESLAQRWEQKKVTPGQSDYLSGGVNVPAAPYAAARQDTAALSYSLYNDLDYMTEEEAAIYNYYYAKYGREKAEEYLYSIREDLNRQVAEKMFADIEGKTARELGFGVAAGLDQFVSGIANIGESFTEDKRYIPLSPTQIASGMVREDLEDDSIPLWYNFKTGKWEDKILGNSAAQIGYDAITTTANMAPSILTSMAVSLVNPTAGVAVGSGLMGASAAGGAYQEALNEGYSPDQARGYGLLVGASEIALEKVLGGISALGGNALGKTAIKNLDNASAALKRIAKVAGGAVSEFSEEYLQEVLTPVYRNMVLGTGEEVKLYSAEALYSGFLGALTGGTVEAAGTSSVSGNYKAAQPAMETHGAKPTQKTESAMHFDRAGEMTIGNGQQKTAAPEETAVNVRSAGPAITEKSKADNTLAYILASNIDAVQDMEPVAQLSGREMNNRAKPVTDQIKEFFRSLGNKITRKGFGDIILGEYGVGGMLNHHPLNRAKMVALAAMPEVVANGRQVSYDPNWKGRGYESFVFAAPVTVNGTQVYVAAVVDRRPDNKFYLTEMVDSEGHFVRIEESPSGNAKNGVTDGVGNTNKVGVTVRPEELSEGSNPSGNAEPMPLPENIIPRQKEEVNGDIVEGRAQGVDTREASAAGEETGLADTRGIEKDMDENIRQAILAKKKLKVVENVRSVSYTEDIRSIEALPAKAKSKVEKIIRPLAEKLGILNRGLKTPDVEIEFQFSRNKGLKESLSKQLRYGGSYADFARALVNLDSILKNAVLIEKHGDKYKGTAREDRRLESVSVLVGICRDGNAIIPVQMEIKESSVNGGQLYVTVAMTKIEADVLGSAVGKNQGRSLISASEYSLPELFSKINPADKHFLKYVPDGFLSEAQKQAKQSALREDAARIAQYGRTGAEQIGNGGSFTHDGNADALYQQMVEQYIAQAAGDGAEESFGDYEQWLRELLAREG